MERIGAGAHLPTPWLFKPAKHTKDRADYYLDFSFQPQCMHQVLVFLNEWTGARPMGEQW